MFSSVNIIEDFLVGICVGSFINVVIFRLPNQMSILSPRSFCPKCNKTIPWRSNIPLLSFILQKGKCSFCGKKISFQYPLIEFLAGLLFVIFSSSSPYIYSYEIGLSFEKIFSWTFLSILISISFIDLKYFWIPQNLIYFGFLSGVCNLLIVDLLSSNSLNNSFLIQGFIGSLGAYIVFECIRITARFIYKKEALGKGDSKLVSMMALWLGPIGIFLSIGIAYISAAIFLIKLFLVKKIKKNQIIPFAPFLSLGGLIVWYFGNEYLIDLIYGL